MKSDRLLARLRACAAAPVVLLILVGLSPPARADGAARFPAPLSLPGRGRLARPAQSRLEAAAGTLLVASRELQDPNFKESVVLLIAHDGNGALGLVINRPTAIGLEKMLPGIAGLENRRLYFGGPVSAGRPLFLLRSNTPPQSGQEVLENVYVGADELVLKRAIAEGSAEYRLYAGYAGWGPGQLEAELARGDWHVLPAEADHVFSEQPARLWDRLIARVEELRVARGEPGAGGA